jgi:hypothetical protein
MLYRCYHGTTVTSKRASKPILIISGATTFKEDIETADWAYSQASSAHTEI